jgi:hypothetical protein
MPNDALPKVRGCAISPNPTGEDMKLEQFVKQAKLDVEMFAESYKQHAQAEPDVYESNHDVERWWQEFNAYQTVLVLQDRLRGS